MKRSLGLLIQKQTWREQMGGRCTHTAAAVVDFAHKLESCPPATGTTRVTLPRTFDAALAGCFVLSIKFGWLFEQN